MADLRECARRHVPRPVFDFADGAALDEVTARANVSDLERLRILPRPLIDVDEIELGVSVLGRRLAVPWMGAPTGLTALQHVRGELAVARACADAGTLYIASTMGSYAIDEIRTACD